MFIFYTADNRCRYFATFRQYFSGMKKRIAWNSTQTWVTIVKHHGVVRRQPSAYRTKPGSECYVTDRFIAMIAERSEYCALLDAVGGLRVVRNSTENLR